MKKIFVIVVFLALTLSGRLLWADISCETNIGLTGSTGYFILLGANDSIWGTSSIYYDDNKKTMVIRIKSPTSKTGVTSGYFYCYENENPKLYNIILTFVQKCLDGYQNNNAKNGDGSSAAASGYHAINIWYKTISSKNFIKGISFSVND